METIKQTMRCLLEDRKIPHTTNWPNQIQEMTFVCNSLPNSSTGITPHEVMYGSKLRTDIDGWLPVLDDEGFGEWKTMLIILRDARRCCGGMQIGILWMHKRE